MSGISTSIVNGYRFLWNYDTVECCVKDLISNGFITCNVRDLSCLLHNNLIVNPEDVHNLIKPRYSIVGYYFGKYLIFDTLHPDNTTGYYSLTRKQLDDLIDNYPLPKGMFKDGICLAGYDWTNKEEHRVIYSVNPQYLPEVNIKIENFNSSTELYTIESSLKYFLYGKDSEYTTSEALNLNQLSNLAYVYMLRNRKQIIENFNDTIKPLKIISYYKDNFKVKSMLTGDTREYTYYELINFLLDNVDISFNFKDNSFIDGMQMYLKNGNIYFHTDINNATYNKVKTGIKFKIYPNKRQLPILAKNFGCKRLIYNRLLEDTKDYYNQHKKTYIPPYGKYRNEYPFLNDPDIDSCNLNNTRKDFTISMDRYFKNVSRFPKFKKKNDSKQTYRTPNNNNTIEILDKNHIKLPKLGVIECRSSIENFRKAFYGKIYNATLTKERTGSYCCSLTVDYYYKQYEKPETQESVGIDLGIKNYITLSDGSSIPNPSYLLQSLQKIKNLHKSLSRKEKQQKLSGRKDRSNNYIKERQKLAKLYRKVHNQMQDFLHKLSKQIVSKNHVIVCEKLRIKNLLKNHKLARSISSASWYELTRQLMYKSNFNDKIFHQVSPNFASSQICSNCGSRDRSMKKLSKRTYNCPNCGFTLDRDLNAAINILKKGLAELSVANT